MDNPQSLNKYQYTYNNPVNLTDDDGHCPICPAVVEIVTTAADVISTVQTLRDPYASRTEKIVVTAASAAGLFVPGGGGGAVAKLGFKLAKREAAQQVVTKGANDAAEVIIDGAKHPEAAKHVRDAQKSGQPKNLEVGDPATKSQRRSEAMKGHPKAKGKDRDEYPPAWSKQGGRGASIRPISRRDNRGSGASMGNQIRGLHPGTRVNVKPINVPKKKEPQ